MAHSCQELLFGVFLFDSWLEPSSQQSLMGKTENLGKLQERSVALYSEGLSVLTGITECGRSGSVPLGSDGHKSNLSGL